MGNQIHLACWKDDVKTLQNLESVIPDLFKRPGTFGASPFHVAVFRGSMDCLEFILTEQTYGDLYETFGGGIAAFQIAQEACQETALVLLNHQKRDDRPFHIFKLETDHALSYSKACLNLENEAKMKGILNCISSGRNINAPLIPGGPNHFTPLFLSVVMNDVKGVTELLAQGASIGSVFLSSRNLLCIVAAMGFSKLVPVLIDAGFSISYEPGAYTPLVIAAQYGNLPCVKAITTRKEYDPTTAGAHRALCEATTHGSFHVISTLVKAGATANKVYYEDICDLPLHTAAVYDHRAVIEKLLALGADPLCSNKDYGPSCTCTALSLAAKFGSSSVVKPLIDAGLSPTEPCEDTDHLAPVIEANIKGFFAFVKAVVNCGYDPNSLGPQRCSLLEHALHIRYYQKREEISPTILPVYLERLIGIGCHISSCNGKSGFMPIHLAAQFNDVPAIEILLKHEESVDVLIAICTGLVDKMTNAI